MLSLENFYTLYFRLYFRLCICLNKLSINSQSWASFRSWNGNEERERLDIHIGTIVPVERVLLGENNRIRRVPKYGHSRYLRNY